MALIHRISRIFKADVHAVLDRIEEPEALLAQAIRDMEDELVAAERRIAQCVREQNSLDTKKRDLEETIEATRRQLDLCFDSGKTDLARGQIRKRLESERLLKRLNESLATGKVRLGEQKAQLEDNRAALESLRQKAELFTQTSDLRANARTESAAWPSSDLAVSEDEVEIELLREQSARQAS
ncbi:MAG: PspA/IM30 family protein [Pseudomonadota bacterium]